MIRKFISRVFGRKAPANSGDATVVGANKHGIRRESLSSGSLRTVETLQQQGFKAYVVGGAVRDLIAGRLDVEDLVEAWNARFLKDFGVAVDRPAHGVLQDVHWSVGLFGYFPTYALGNVYAGCLNAAMRQAVPDLDRFLAQGDAGPAVEWLRENMQRHGGLYPPG